MADTDARTGGSGDEARKPSLRPNPVLDLKATEVTGDAAPPDADAPPAGEPAAQESSEPQAPASDEPAAAEAPETGDPEPPARTDPPPAERGRTGTVIAAALAGAALGIAGVAALATADLLPRPPAASVAPAPDPRIAVLESRLSELAARPEPRPVPAPAPDPAIAEARQELQGVRNELQDNSQTLRDLQAAVADLREKTATIGASADTSALRGEFEERIAVLTRQLAALGDSVKAIEPGIGRAAFEEQSRRIDDLARQTEQRDAQTRAHTEARAGAAARIAALVALDNAVQRGTPFRAELDALSRLVPGLDAGPLAAGAAAGLPRPEAIGRRLAGAIEAAPRPEPAPTTGGLADRLLAGARGLVKITPAGEGAAPAGDDPAAARQRVLSRLGQGDWAGALAGLDALDPAAKSAGAESAEALRRRLAADAGLAELRARALAAMERTSEGAKP